MSNRFNLHSDTPRPTPTQVHNAAGLDNVRSWELVETANRVGLETIVVCVPRAKIGLIGGDFQDKLGRALEAARMGSLDSTIWGTITDSHFFHVPRAKLQQAIEFLGATIERAGLAGSDFRMAVADGALRAWRLVWRTLDSAGAQPGEPPQNA